MRTFDDVFQARLGQAPSTCYFAGNCTRIVGFDPNGDVLPCTRPFDRSRYTYGNIADTPLEAIVAGPSFVGFQREDLAAQERSRSCPWFELCHDGCPQHRQTDGAQDVAGANLYCACQSGVPGGHAAIFAHIVSRTDAVLDALDD